MTTRPSLLVATPAVAMAIVAAGLLWGAPPATTRAALVRAAPPANAGTGFAWQVEVLDDALGTRQPAAGVSIAVEGPGCTWAGRTDDDGVAEALLAGNDAPRWLRVREGATLLAEGETILSPIDAPAPAPAPVPVWMPFAQRHGPIAMDVAVLGQRVAPGFPAHLWVRATDEASGAPVSGATVEPDADPSVTLETREARTDSRGWAELVVTPVGLAISFALRATAAVEGNREVTSDWSGGLHVSPGAPRIEGRPLFTPDEEPVLEVTPAQRPELYVEIDDAHDREHGRAWAQITSGGEVRVPRLHPGLYWAVASGSPEGAASLAPGSAARPFFVARSDQAALTLASGPGCDAPRDPRDLGRAVWTCLATAQAGPVRRWTALDGFAHEGARRMRRRRQGLAIALGGLLGGATVEALLFARMASKSARRRGAVLLVVASFAVALLGFALLAIFLSAGALP